MRLLIVEDSALMRRLTRAAFAAKEYEIEEADNGYGGLAQVSLARQPFDAIVLDLRMPDMNGPEFLRALRQRPLHRETPVVVATSEGDDSELLLEVRRMGVSAVVKKPWRGEVLVAAVREAGGLRSSPATRPPLRPTSRDFR
jgi:two-component system chemotaxis response regulator CheY